MRSQSLPGTTPGFGWADATPPSRLPVNRRTRTKHRRRPGASMSVSARRGELRHDAAGEELERPQRLHVTDPPEVDLHRGLELAEDFDVVPELLDHLVRRPDQRLTVFQHRVDGRPGDRVHHLAVVRVLTRLMGGPRAHRLAEDLDVTLDAWSRALDRIPVRLGHVAVKRALDLLLARRMPGLTPGLAVGADHIPYLSDAPGVGHDHHVVAAPARPDERLHRRDRGDPDGRVRLLQGTRRQVDIAKPVELAVVGHAVLGPEPGDDVDAFLEAGAALLHAHAEHLELLRDERAAEAHVEATVADVVQRRQLGRELDGMVEGRADRAGDRAEPLRARRDGREEDDGIRRVTAVVIEVMLDGLDGVESELVSALGQAQGLGEVLRGRIVARPERREEVETELHRAGSGARSSR